MTSKTKELDVCYLLDTTGSMDEWIKRCKNTIKVISSSLKRQSINIRFSVIGYKDICDRKCEEHTYMCPIECTNSEWIDICDFTDNISEIYNFLDGLTAMGGGDIPEDLFGAIQIANKQTWRINSKKIIVIITDAPPHGKEFSDIVSYSPNYPLPYSGSKLPKEILIDSKINNIEFLVINLNNILKNTITFIENNKLTIKETKLIKDDWKFPLILPDELSSMSVDKVSDTKLVQYKNSPFTTAFFNLNSKLNKNKIKFLIKNCYESGMKDTMRLIMYIRDRNGSLKNKDLGRDTFWYLRQFDNFFVSKYYNDFINKTGCINDLLYLSKKADLVDGKKNHTELLFLAISTINCYLKHLKTENGKKILSEMTNKKRRRHKRIVKFLNKECLQRISNKNHITVEPYFIYKWLPKFGGTKRNGKLRLKKWERENKFASRLSNLMFICPTDLKLKKYIESLPITIPSREIINFIYPNNNPHPEKEVFYREIYSFLGKLCSNPPVEVLMCEKNWKNINLEKVTSGAQNKYKKCFIQKIPEEVKKIISDKKIKTKTLDGNKIISHYIKKHLSRKVKEDFKNSLEDSFVNSQWESFYNENKFSGNFTFQIDNSGSMLADSPMPLSYALQFFLLSGTNKFISFDNPGWCSIQGETLDERVESFLKHMPSFHSDIPNGIKLALEQKEQPLIHFVLTDGRYPNIKLEEVVKVRNKLNKGKLTKIIIIILDNHKELLLQTPDMIGSKDIYIVTGNSLDLIKIFLTLENNNEDSIEKHIRKFLREKYPLVE